MNGWSLSSIKQKFQNTTRKAKILLWVVIAVLLFVYTLKLKKKITSQVRVVRTFDRKKNVPPDETIFVSIVSGPSDLDSAAKCAARLFDSAYCPHRVIIGICRATEQQTRKRGGWKSTTFLDRYKRYSQKYGNIFDNNIRVVNEPVEESVGYGNAMHMIQTYLYRGEKYFLFLDHKLHLRDEWDRTLIHDLKRCAMKSKKPILTQLPYR
jgi:hypothetical protein